MKLRYERKCFKIRYHSRQAAKKDLIAINRRMKNKPDFTQLTDTYFCGECQSYHTTSMAKEDSRILNHKRQNVNKRKGK